MVGKNLEEKFKELLGELENEKAFDALSKNELTILNYAGKREVAKLIMEDLTNFFLYNVNHQRKPTNSLVGMNLAFVDKI